MNWNFFVVVVVTSIAQPLFGHFISVAVTQNKIHTNGELWQYLCMKII